MNTGALDFEIQKYLPLLSNNEKQSLLSVIRSFINLKKENIEVIDIEQYNKDIDEAMARMDKGEFTSHEDLFKELEFDKELEKLSGTILFPEKLKAANEFLHGSKTGR
jgi:hypothetical protein